MATKTKTQLKPSDFVHLHNHSHYSLLDGLQKVPEMLDRAKELGMEAIALTDHGTMSGIIEFYKGAIEREIKPIIGLEAYIAPRSHTDKEGKEDANPNHLTLLAMNNTGYRNLMELSTVSQLEGFYYKPRIDRQLLEKHGEGLIVLSGCMNGEVGNAIAQDQLQKAKETAIWYKSVFGDRYYLEIQDHNEQSPEQTAVNKRVLTIGKELSVPVVVTADAHYCHPHDREAHEVLLCVQTASQLADESRMSLKDFNLFLSDPKDVISRWSDHPEVVSTTKAIADRCDVKIEFGNILIPEYKTPKDTKPNEHLEELAYQGIAWRYLNKSKTDAAKLSHDEVLKAVDKAVVDRLLFELESIHSMALDSYFLIVADFINWAKNQGIVVGPGRGSAAGSIVAYALGITDLEPLQYDLLFERFINPERISMPDIDIDFQDDRRDEVIQYVIDKYGKDRVANIVTFGTMAARNAIRDTARVLGVAYGDADRWAKLVPPPVQGRHTPLSKHIEQNLELKHEYTQNAKAREVMDLAIRLEGTIRSHGVHAAGVVIAPEKITNYAPLEMAQKGVIATQYSMNPLDDLGLLKMDFLGLSNLTTIKNALRIIRKVYGKEIDISSIALDDEKTFKLLAKGDTTGVFQLESAGMKRYIKQLKPNRIDDIIAMVALYRPGPMQWIEDFISRKNGRKQTEYLHPAMEAALKNTYGVIVYQEQVMQISKDMCGFSGGEADTLRKAIGKKIPEVLAKQKDRFIEGAIKTSGVKRQVVEKLWKSLEDFAAYAFNKSHAACYALIAYQTAYLKAHYPAAFMAALMTSDFGDTDRIAIEINECRHMGIEVLPPDINESFVEFAVRPKDEAIRFGMAAIKNVGVGAVEHILEVREQGKFKSVEDFARRVSPQFVNKKVWESLIKCGALDSLAERSALLLNLENVLAFATKVHKEAAAGQTDLFGDSSNKDVTINLLLHAAETNNLNDRERLQWERALLGVYLSRHPLEEYRSFFDNKLTAIEKLNHELEGKSVTVGGFITDVRRITTRNGMNMAFVKIEDLSGELELIVFPKLFDATQDLWEVDKVITTTGKVNTKDRDGHRMSELKILADEACELDHDTAVNFKPAEPAAAQADASRHVAQQLIIQVPSSDDTNKLAAMKDLLSKYKGTCEVVVVIGDNAATKIRLPFTVNVSEELTANLQKLFSEEAIKIK